MPQLEVKDAVKAAKSFVHDLLFEEGLTNLGLEEVQFDEVQNVWDVTVGFSRPWNSTRGALSAITGEELAKRAYRVVRVRDVDGQVVSMKKRELVD